MRLVPELTPSSPLPFLSTLALSLLAAGACGGNRYVPVHTGVASLHQSATPACSNVVATPGPMDVSRTAYVHVEACGSQSSYICTTDTVPSENAESHARAQCALVGSLRGAEIMSSERQRQEQDAWRSAPRRGVQGHAQTFQPPAGPLPTPPPGYAP